MHGRKAAIDKPSNCECFSADADHMQNNTQELHVTDT